jgi:hypothetical protein
VSLVEDLPDELTLHFITDPHTAVTENALRHVDVDIWMRVVDAGPFLYSHEVSFFQAVLNCATMKWVVWLSSKGVPGVVLRQHFQDHAPLVLDA